MSADALSSEVRDRVAQALEQLKNLYDDIMRAGALPADTDVAIAIARHHLRAAARRLQRASSPQGRN